MILRVDNIIKAAPRQRQGHWISTGCIKWFQKNQLVKAIGTLLAQALNKQRHKSVQKYMMVKSHGRKNWIFTA